MLQRGGVVGVGEDKGGGGREGQEKKGSGSDLHDRQVDLGGGSGLKRKDAKAKAKGRGTKEGGREGLGVLLAEECA
jgi:hypothetical protein